jgi:hypothetical protein
MRRLAVLLAWGLTVVIMAAITPAVHAQTACTTSADCDDGDPCTIDLCSATDGCWHAAKCDDGSPCTVDACVNGSCGAHTPDHARCTDGSFCNGEEVCDPTNASANGDGCVSGTSPCAGGACVVEQCDEAQDACIASSSGCTDDGLVCNGIPTCNAQTAACEPTNVPDCSAVVCPLGYIPVCSETAYALTGNPCTCEDGSTIDRDGNGIPDVVDRLCPCSAGGNGGNYMACVAKALAELRRASVFDPETAGRIASVAARSGCGL